ncbi:TPA: poly(hydroxyalcanoate) granule associated protein, partial [Acinetobacter baumannii]
MDNANIETQAEEQGEKNKSKSKSSRKSALDFRKYTKQIWLAGLGA